MGEVPMGLGGELASRGGALAQRMAVDVASGIQRQRQRLKVGIERLYPSVRSEARVMRVACSEEEVELQEAAAEGAEEAMEAGKAQPGRRGSVVECAEDAAAEEAAAAEEEVDTARPNGAEVAKKAAARHGGGLARSRAVKEEGKRDATEHEEQAFKAWAAADRRAERQLAAAADVMASMASDKAARRTKDVKAKAAGQGRLAVEAARERVAAARTRMEAPSEQPPVADVLAPVVAAATPVVTAAIPVVTAAASARDLAMAMLLLVNTVMMEMAADVAAEAAAEMTAKAAAEVTAQVAAQVVTEAVADEGYISRTSGPAMPDDGALRRERQGAELGDERGMSWERLLTVRDELFADDVPLPADVNLSRWSEARARRYFESGGLEGQIETV